MKNRKEIDAKYKIDLSDIFKNIDEFNDELKKLNKDVIKISKFKKHIMESPKKLYDLLLLKENLETRFESVYVYASTNRDCDLSDSIYGECYGKVMQLYSKFSGLTSFIIPEILETDYSIAKNYMDTYEDLKKFKIYLNEIYRNKKHILSKDAEEVIAKLTNTFSFPSEITETLRDVDLKFDNIKDEEGKEIELTEANHNIYFESKNREVRKNAFEVFYKGYESIIDTSSIALSSEVSKNNILSDIRKFKSSLEKELFENEVDLKVYHSLIENVSSKMKLFYKHNNLLKETLKLKELHMYDLNAPITDKEIKNYTFDEGRALVEESLLILGEEYSKLIQKAFNENWIDVYPTKNKRSGGYCNCSYNEHPVVMINYTDKYEDVSTLTHELGHAMHYQYALDNNNYTNYHYSIFVAEVASQVNEILLFKSLMNKDTSKEEKIKLLNDFLKRFKSTVNRQTMFAEFELKIHEDEKNGEVLTKEYLNNTYYNLVKKYFGKDVIIDDAIKYEWSRIPHFYYKFYVYQYATGFISAVKIADDIWNKKPDAKEKYLEFLKLGCTKDPVSSLKVAGVDITNKKAYATAFKVYENALNEFEKLVNSKD